MPKKNAARQGRGYERDQWEKVCKSSKVAKKEHILLGYAYLELLDLGASRSAQALQDQIAKFLTDAGLPTPQEDTRLEEDPTDEDDDAAEYARL